MISLEDIVFPVRENKVVYTKNDPDNSLCIDSNPLTYNTCSEYNTYVEGCVRSRLKERNDFVREVQFLEDSSGQQFYCYVDETGWKITNQFDPELTLLLLSAKEF